MRISGIDRATVVRPTDTEGEEVLDSFTKARLKDGDFHGCSIVGIGYQQRCRASRVSAHAHNRGATFETPSFVGFQY